MSKIKILFVEDDPYLGLMVNDLFESRGYEVFYRKDAESGLDTYKLDGPDLCVLDVVLPGMNGFELAKKIRSDNPDIPSIFLTARNHKDDIIEGYSSGADDYLRKPFHMEELILRVDALLRRLNTGNLPASRTHVYSFADCQFDSELMTLAIGSTCVELTPKEAGMLKIFCDHPGKLIERDYILKQVWGDDSYYNIKSMDVFMHKLRSRFKNEPRFKIQNIRAKGFRLVITD